MSYGGFYQYLVNKQSIIIFCSMYYTNETTAVKEGRVRNQDKDYQSNYRGITLNLKSEQTKENWKWG